MRLNRLIAILVTSTINFGSASPTFAVSGAELSSIIEDEREIALHGVLDNIGPHGKKAPGALAGVVVASPSTEDPNYFYTWTRDSALTFKMLVDEFIKGNGDLRTYIQNYIKAQAILQTVSNPSGSLSSGRGLGEPKFYVNETRFNGAWGRPQRDGPALRAITLITYSRWLLENGDAAEAKNVVWPVISNDLEYVAQYWNQTGFDLWEEVSGSSFFTTAVQHRALVEGSALAKRMDLPCENWDTQAPNILCFLQTFWNGKYIAANINTAASRTGIDANTVLASLATFDPDASCDDFIFQPCSHRALANLKVYVDSFRDIYSINARIPESKAVATGRYAEDVYFGGNPWYLCTLAVAELIYDAVQQWKNQGQITITGCDLSFWKSIYPKAREGRYGSDSDTFEELIDSAMEFADGFVRVIHSYLPQSGALAEQFSRRNGTALSANDLTWSYASYVTMSSARDAALAPNAAAREVIQVPSWHSSSESSVPDICIASSVPGNYSPATEAGAPPGAGGCTVTVLFNVNASTYYGENIYLTGNTSDLGGWDLANALPGNAAKYTTARPLWTFEVDLPASSAIEYQYLKQEEDGNWLQETMNRTYTVPGCGTEAETGAAVVEDEWTGPTGTPSMKIRLRRLARGLRNLVGM